jgi:hypothetical protein
MNNKNKLYIFLLLSTLLAIESCKTDFEINAPYDDIPIVFAALDQSVDTQYVKINKTYLGGTGDNTTYAAINDSVLFPSLSATIDEVKDGAVTNSYLLSEKWAKGIEPGLFNTDSQKVYFFVPNGGLDSSATYNLRVNIDEGRKEVTASTKLVEGFDFVSTFKIQVHAGINFAGQNQSYSDLTMKWTTAKGASIYESGLVFYYDEYNQNGVIEKSIPWSFGKSTSLTTNGGEELSKEILGDGFYKVIAAKLEGYSNEPNVTKRVFKRVEFIVSAAGEDLSTYIGVNEPSNSIVSERPNFTNIVGGLGIFSSRTKLVMKEYLVGFPFQLNINSKAELVGGQYTGTLKFEP